MLTDINGSYYSINNGYVYVELYAHNPFLHSYPMEEQSPLSGDFKLMNPGEKIRIQKKYVLQHYEYNNFKLGYDFKMEDPNLKVEFLIGYFKETSCGKNNQTYSYAYLNTRQRVNDLLSKEEYMRLPTDSQLKYILMNCNNRFFEFEMPDFAKIAGENVSDLKYLIKEVKKFDFYSKKGTRDYRIDAIFYIEGQILIRNANFVESYELRRLLLGKLIAQTPESLNTSKEYRDLIICLFGNSIFANFLSNYSETPIQNVLKKRYSDLKYDNGDITDYMFCYSFLYGLIKT